MNKQKNIAVCLESAYSINQNTIEASGRYIKAIRQVYGLTSNPNEKIKCEYKLTRSLQKHIILLQENIVYNSGKPTTKKIDTTIAKNLIKASKSIVAINNDKFSYVDIDSLRNMQVLDKTVVLKKDVVLPIKVKSSDQTYKFNAQIILSKNNILSYASNTLSTEEINDKLYKLTPIEKLGSGIKNNEIIEKANSVKVNR